MAETEKTAPVQGFSQGIPWEMHLRAYDAYCKRYRPQPALIQGGCRGGFAADELDEFIPGWRQELTTIGRQRAEIEKLQEALRRYADKSRMALCIRKAFSRLSTVRSAIPRHRYSVTYRELIRW